MKLSIIIPIYNAQEFLEECIESIMTKISQDYLEDIELILVNDGSMDNSLNICNKYVKKYSNIKVFDNENNGVSYSRNFGIKQAKGKYVMFVDSDDKLSNEWFEIVKEYIDSSYDIVFFSEKYDGKKITGNEIESIIKGVIDGNIYLSSPCSKIYKREYIIDNKICFRSNLISGEDIIYNLEMFSGTKNYIGVKKSIYLYRANSNSVTRSFDPRMLENSMKYRKILKEIVNKSDMEEIEKKAILNLSISNSLFRIANVLSNSLDYKVFLKYSYIFNEYLKEIDNIFTINLSYKRKLIIFLLKIKQYYIVFSLFNLIKKKSRKTINTFKII